MIGSIEPREYPATAKGWGLRVAVTALSMRYTTASGPIQALDGVTMTVEPGTTVAIVGPSGSGKSTLLGILGGLETPTSGEVRVGPHLISAMAEPDRAALRRRHVGFVFQADNLQPFLTASENVGLQAVLAGLADVPAQTRALLESLDVISLERRFPDELSGGQRQRIAVARAIVHNPGIILADEPTGSLDGASANRVVELLLQHHTTHGATLVVVTHDRAVADRMSIVLEMRAGRMAGPT